MSLAAMERAAVERISREHERLLEDLRHHVALATGPGGFDALDRARRELTQRLERLGARTTLVPGDPRPAWITPGGAESKIPPVARCTRRVREGAPRILLSGHLDTVHDPQGEFRELTLSNDGRTATGPGCVDMKGGLVIAVRAVEILHELGAEINWSFVLNSDEETGSYHSDAALRAAAREHDFGLALEPAMEDGGLVIERPGSGQFMVECRGKAAHVGRAFASGVSAVNELARQLLRISAMPDASRGIIVSVGPLQGGIAPNVVPDLARAWGNARYPTPEVGESIRRELLELQTDPDAMPGVRVFESFNRPAKPCTPATMALAELARGAAKDLGQALPFGKTGGVCDGNNLQAGGLATIDTLGVRGGGLHTPHEWIELASLVERCQLLAVVLLRLARASVRA